MNKYDIAIIGAGASGIMCAISANKQKKVVLIEKADKIGKKILVTGNGRCNITNDYISSDSYNTTLVQKYFDKYGKDDTLQEFKKMGLLTYSDNEGRRYPISNSANSVLDILLAKLNNCNNVDIVTNYEIVKVDRLNNRYKIFSKEHYKPNRVRKLRYCNRW